MSEHNSEAFRQWTLRPWREDHKVEIHQNGISCGVRTISNINKFTTVDKFISFVNGKDPAKGDRALLEKGYQYIFSDNKNGSGKDWAAWIKKYKLGSIISTSWQMNPNSDARIKVWIWRYNGKKVNLNAQPT
jgi:hypothetical protein